MFCLEVILKNFSDFLHKPHKIQKLLSFFLEIWIYLLFPKLFENYENNLEQFRKVSIWKKVSRKNRMNFFSTYFWKIKKKFCKNNTKNQNFVKNLKKKKFFFTVLCYIFVKMFISLTNSESIFLKKLQKYFFWPITFYANVF